MVRQTYSTHFPVEPLGNLIEGFKGGVNFPPVPEGEPASEWRVLKISAVTWGEFNPYESKPISPNVTFDDSLIVRQGDLIMSRANTTELVGSVCLVRTPPPKVLLPDKLWRIKFPKNSKLLPEYALLALRSPELRRIIGDLATGTSGSMKNISMEKAATLPIPLAPLAEQKRITAIAQKTDRLRRTRRYALQLSDTYLQSVFLEMFGNPVTNPEGWDILRLNKLCTNITDGTHDTPDRLPSGVPFITSKNIRPYQMDLTNLEFVSLETHQEIIKRCNPSWGDILYTNIGVNVGNAVANRLNFSFSLKNVALLQPNHKILNHFFLESLLNNENFKRYLIQISSIGGAQKFISLEVLRNISVIKPPLPLQEKFAQIVQKFDRLRTLQREADRQAEHLFETLLHRAFRGELTSSDIDEEPASNPLDPNSQKPTKPETTAKAGHTSTRKTARNSDTFTEQQYTEAIQLKIPGFE